MFRFIKYTWYLLLKGLRFKTVLNQFAHRYILLILGIAALATANILAKKLTTLVGGTLLLAGVIQGIYAWRLRQLLAILNAMLYLGIGILLIVTPIQGAFTLMLLLALFFALEGIFEMGMALKGATST